MDKTQVRNKLIKHYLKLFKEATGNGIASENIKSILQESFKNGETEKDFNFENKSKQIDNELNRKREFFCKGLAWRPSTFAVIFLVGIVSASAAYYCQGTLMEMTGIDSWQCIIENNVVVSELSRPLATCDFCNTLDSVPIEYSISSQDFRRKYSYTSVPVLIKNATLGWSAMTVFSYNYLKDLYTETEGALASVDEECQFFHYNTDFNNLTEVFNMSDARANFTDGEKSWYIGWSNCHNEVKNELRNHYERPYFLPNDSESSALDWIFMGGSGPGALIHLDYVQRPSWQAQISGKKTWTLIPPPECEKECKDLNVTVHKGDIFVIDTNIWYHSTFIHPGDISITIGSEYD
ncbi:uncharacterized protein LOC123563114 isoform X1 [Mercenaria mercenaria]|uniref:uncharacterized protein LOC123563114 isoform X1 n=1 Tax=Mercenaria mercenaria TaxID=6596 RepID=UPI00234E3B14|nr:uncharacterized protein LOC123563114 isoform X1 [Mercenaria mercenaria]